MNTFLPNNKSERRFLLVFLALGLLVIYLIGVLDCLGFQHYYVDRNEQISINFRRFVHSVQIKEDGKDKWKVRYFIKNPKNTYAGYDWHDVMIHKKTASVLNAFITDRRSYWHFENGRCEEIKTIFAPTNSP